jgi:hypoxanthine phosphoribosyltransferase
MAKIRYRVETLDSRALGKAAQTLCTQVAHTFRPHIVIGIRSGGYQLALRMQQNFEAGIRLLDVTCRRPSTAKKNKFRWLWTVMKYMPLWIRDPLRIAEHRARLFKNGLMRQGQRTIPANEIAAIEEALRDYAQPRVLIVDDAIDTGATLQAVAGQIASIAPMHAMIRTAALTVTSAAPLIEPDYVIYRHVLCRFPWSRDFRQADDSDLRPGWHHPVDKQFPHMGPASALWNIRIEPVEAHHGYLADAGGDAATQAFVSPPSNH